MTVGAPAVPGSLRMYPVKLGSLFHAVAASCMFDEFPVRLTAANNASGEKASSAGLFAANSLWPCGTRPEVAVTTITSEFGRSTLESSESVACGMWQGVRAQLFAVGKPGDDRCNVNPQA